MKVKVKVTALGHKRMAELAVGDTIEVSEIRAARWTDCGFVEPVTEPAAAPVKKPAPVATKRAAKSGL